MSIGSVFGLLLMITILTTGNLVYVEPSCWYPHVIENGVAISTTFVVLWDSYAEQPEHIPIEQMSNLISPANYNGGQPVDYLTGHHRAIHATHIHHKTLLASKSIAWVLNGNVTHLTHTFLSPQNMCSTKYRDSCITEVSEFCNTLDTCNGRGSCDVDTFTCSILPEDSQRCKDRTDGRTTCNSEKNRCLQCESNEDCFSGERDWCSGDPPVCDSHRGVCLPARTPPPCENNPHGCSNEFEMCNECTDHSDCTDFDSNTPFCKTDWQCMMGQCIRRDNHSPCSKTEVCSELVRHCIPVQKGEEANVYNALDSTEQLLINGVTSKENQVEDRECLVDSECRDRHVSEYTFCTGGPPFCDHLSGKCVSHDAPICGNGYCDEGKDTCVQCLVDSDCEQHVNWCDGERQCNPHTNVCQVVSTRCNKDKIHNTCIEASQVCVTSVCETHADCPETTFCGGIHRCDDETKTCYVVPGSIACTGIQGCDEVSQTCTPVSRLFTVLFALVFGITLIIAVLYAFAPPVNFCRAPKQMRCCYRPKEEEDY